MSFPRTAIVLIGLAAGASAPAADRPSTAVVWEASTFHYGYGSSADFPQEVDVSGVEVEIALGRGRWSVRASAPVISVSAPGAVLLAGSGAGGLRRGSSAQESSAGPGGTSGRGPAAGSAMTDSFGDARETGFGDVRVKAAVRLLDAPRGGRLSARAGVKLPTANEERGLGTGRLDAWAGLGWRREGWTTGVEAFVEWRSLGDPDGIPLEDGPAGGLFLHWPIGRGELSVGTEAYTAAYAGDAAPWSAVTTAVFPAGRRAEAAFELHAGLSETAPDLGLTFGLRF